MFQFNPYFVQPTHLTNMLIETPLLTAYYSTIKDGKCSSWDLFFHASAVQQQGKLCNGIFRASASYKMIVAIIEDDRDLISFDVQIN